MKVFHNVIEAVPPSLLVAESTVTLDVEIEVSEVHEQYRTRPERLDVHAIVLKTQRLKPVLALVHKDISLDYLHQQLKGVIETGGGPGYMLHANDFTLQIAVYDFTTSWGANFNAFRYSLLNPNAKSLDLNSYLTPFFK